MKVKIFTLKFSALSGGFDDVEVRAFIADKEVQEQFLSHEAFEFAIRGVDETGRMLGGWTKQQQEEKR